MSDFVKAAESAKAQRLHNATMGIVVTDMNALMAKKEADQKAAREAAAQRARDEYNQRQREYTQRLENARKRAEADCQGMWDQHMKDFKAAQAEVMAAEDGLLKAQLDAIDAEFGVRNTFKELNDLRIAQDFTQDVAGVAISGAGFFLTGGLSFVILTGLGVANNLARPDVVGAAQDAFNNGVAELAGRNGYTVGGNTVSAFALGKDALEFTKPADLYNFQFSSLANPDDIQKIREFFAKDPRGLAEKIWGPSVDEVDGKLKKWQDALKNRDAKAEQLRQAKAKLAKISGQAGNWSICVGRRMNQLMGF
jgi:hypothetical protein